MGANGLTGRSWLGNMGERCNVIIEQRRFGRVHLSWVGSRHMEDYLSCQIDECSRLMDVWPVSWHGRGGGEVNSDDHGQNIASYSMEFTCPDGR